MKGRLRLAVICDAVEEGWPSMDYVAEMLVTHLQGAHSASLETTPVKPRFFGGFERVFSGGHAFNVDRAVTRFLTYPLSLLGKRRKFDIFHIADHTYAHLAHVLPADRTGVFCHDLDAFESLLQPTSRERQWRKAMAQAQLSGLQRASVVFYSTKQVRKQIEHARMVEPARLVHAPYGVDPVFFTSLPPEDVPPGVLPSNPFVLHVGSSLPRKRLDILFRVFAAVRKRHPDLRLVQQGATLSSDQRALLEALGIQDALLQPPRLPRVVLATLYSRAELVLLTSEREGFGLPLLEALAAGASVIVSDIPAFREVGGEAATYCPVGDVEAWVETMVRLLEQPSLRPSPAARRQVSERFTWKTHAATISQAYSRMMLT